jgi:hypothetical protein
MKSLKYLVHKVQRRRSGPESGMGEGSFRYGPDKNMGNAFEVDRKVRGGGTPGDDQKVGKRTSFM